MGTPHFVMISFSVQKLLSSVRFHLFIFVLIVINKWQLSQGCYFFLTIKNTNKIISAEEHALSSAFTPNKSKKLKSGKKNKIRSSHCGSVEMNLTCIHEDTGLIPGLDQWVKDLASP